MAKVYYCKRCRTQMSESEHGDSRMYTTLYMGMCGSCRGAVGAAIDRAVEMYESNLRSKSRHTSDEIDRMVSRFRDRQQSQDPTWR